VELVSRAQIEQWLAEDIGPGDITSQAVIPKEAFATGRFICKEEGTVAGLGLLPLVFSCLDRDIVVTANVQDGERVSAGTVLALVSGKARPILAGERLALNLLRHMSGIATRTRALVEMVREYNVRIVDTRKTTPGLRALEKYAVRVGGGSNHRFGLYDGVLIKDNHIAVGGGIRAAVQKARKFCPHTVKIEVEVEDLDGVVEALEAGADVILLDNMPPALMAEAVRIGRGRCLFEASGGITESTIRDVAAAGVDLISVGALTHSVKALDISLDVQMSIER